MTKDLNEFVSESAAELSRRKSEYDKLLVATTTQIAKRIGCAFPAKAGHCMVEEILDNPPENTQKAWTKALMLLIEDTKSEWRRTEARERADALEREVARLRKIADD